MLNLLMLRNTTLFILLLVTNRAMAQDPDCLHPTVALSVIDSKANLVRDLTAADFEARVKGRPVRVVSVTPDNRSHRVVLVMDMTGAMSSFGVGEPARWGWELGMARHFFEQNRRDTQIAAVILTKRIHEVAPFSEESAAANASLSEAAKGYGHMKKNLDPVMTLDEAILEGIQLLDPPASSDALYVLTNAEEYGGSTRGPSEDISKLVEKHIRLFAIVLQEDVGFRQKTHEEIMGPEVISQIARKSGGGLLTGAEWHDNRVVLSAFPDEKATTQEILMRLYQAILQNSLMQIELSAPMEKGEGFELSLSSSARKKWKRVKLMYPPTLTACHSDPATN